MIVTIHNRKYNDEIAFKIDELNEETKQDILDSVHSRGCAELQYCKWF